MVRVHAFELHLLHLRHLREPEHGQVRGGLHRARPAQDRELLLPDAVRLGPAVARADLYHADRDPGPEFLPRLQLSDLPEGQLSALHAAHVPG